jgi:hypothetical protein
LGGCFTEGLVYEVFDVSDDTGNGFHRFFEGRFWDVRDGDEFDRGVWLEFTADVAVVSEAEIAEDAFARFSVDVLEIRVRVSVDFTFGCVGDDYGVELHVAGFG